MTTYLFYGSDRGRVLKESENLVKKFFDKDPHLTYEKFDADTLNIEAIASLAGTSSLFGSKSLVVIDGAIATNEEFLDIIPGLHLSEHTFVIREEELTKPILKKIEKHAEKIEEFTKKEGKKEMFNVFAFTDALGEKNKKNAWILYQKALMSGMVAEELYFKVVWQVKTLLLALRTQSAEESGLNPYVFRKAKGNLRFWKPDELKKLSSDLVIGYHEARRGRGEIAALVEKKILSL